VEDRSDLAAMYLLAFDIAGFENQGSAGHWPPEAVLIAEFRLARSSWSWTCKLPDLDGLRKCVTRWRRRGILTPVIFLSIHRRRCDDSSRHEQSVPSTIS